MAVAPIWSCRLTARVAAAEIQIAAQTREGLQSAEFVALDDMADKFPERVFTEDHKKADVTNVAFIARAKNLSEHFCFRMDGQRQVFKIGFLQRISRVSR